MPSSPRNKYPLTRLRRPELTESTRSSTPSKNLFPLFSHISSACFQQLARNRLSDLLTAPVFFSRKVGTRRKFRKERSIHEHSSARRSQHSESPLRRAAVQATKRDLSHRTPGPGCYQWSRQGKSSRNAIRTGLYAARDFMRAGEEEDTPRPSSNSWIS